MTSTPNKRTKKDESDDEEEYSIPDDLGDLKRVARVIPSKKKEYFEFKFHDETKRLTAEDCFKQLCSYKSKIELFDEIPNEERIRFVNCALKHEERIIRCMLCDRKYSSATGYINHVTNCNATEMGDDVVRRKRVITRKKMDVDTIGYDELEKCPMSWQLIPMKKQSELIRRIFNNGFKCIVDECSFETKNPAELGRHMTACTLPKYYSYLGNIEEFRKLEPSTKRKLVREVSTYSKDSTMPCLNCKRIFTHVHGIDYHLERCGLDRDKQPWKCYKCNFIGTGADRDDHFSDCMPSPTTSLPAEATSAKSIKLEGPHLKVLVNSNGTPTYTYRRSLIAKDPPTKRKSDRATYMKRCNTTIDHWQKKYDYCSTLKEAINKKTSCTGEVLKRSDPLYNIFKRKSVRLFTEKPKNLKSNSTTGTQIETLCSLAIGDPQSSRCAAGFCGAPINSISVAPNCLSNGHEVICVTTLPNDYDREGESCIAQFWTNRMEDKGKGPNLQHWHSLYVKGYGVIMSSRWLNIKSKVNGFVGFIAFAMSSGNVLIYKISEELVEPRLKRNEKDSVIVYNCSPMMVLTQAEVMIPVENEEDDGDGDDEEPKELVGVKPPITRIDWSYFDGGKTLVGVSVYGHLLFWDLENAEDLPKVVLDKSWYSPPWDVSVFDDKHVAVAFREKLVRLMNIEDFSTKIEDRTPKTAGVRVFCEPRLFNGVFCFQSDQISTPIPHTVCSSHLCVDDNEELYIILPLANRHSTIIWDMSVHLATGTVVSCGVDGRVEWSTSGRLEPSKAPGKVLYTQQGNLIQLKRGKYETVEDESIQKLIESVDDGKKDVKPKLEESIFDDDSVVKNMWLEVEFEAQPLKKPCTQSSRDRRIESLNCIGTSLHFSERTLVYTGGEAGLLFAVTSRK